VAATPELTLAALAGSRELGAGLDAAVPATWPPMYLDPPALEYTLERLAEGPEQEGWWLYFVVAIDDAGSRTLVGSGGYKGPPTQDGTVEVGYGIVTDHQRRGYATRTVHRLLDRAFALPEVHRAIAETLPELQPSIGVLLKCGFHLVGAGSEPGVIRFELKRAEWR
jgi:RimJ/RimL family protein N-acetyltransferase